MAALGGAVAQAAPEPPGGLVASELSNDAAWSWFSDPRAVSYRGNTYMGWISSTGDIVAGAYDHFYGRVQTSVVMANFQIDDHNNPAVLVRPDGRITLFWSAHVGGKMYYRTTVRPEDINEWHPVQTLPTNVAGDRHYTYANPIVLPAERNKLYLFYRAGYTHPAVTTSPNLGKTWTAAQPLIEVEDQRPYVKYASNSRDTIGFGFTNGHPAETHSAIYYAEYRKNALHSADGRVLKPMSQLPLRPAEADLVYTPKPDEDAWVHDTALDSAGNPRIAFVTINRNGAHAYWYAAHDGRRWTTRRMADAGTTIADSKREQYYTAGISLDHSNPDVAFLGRPGDSGKTEIERWATSNSGATWTVDPVTTGSVENNVRPFVPRNADSNGPSVIWMRGRYTFFTNFATRAQARSVAAPTTPAPSRVIVNSGGGVLKAFVFFQAGNGSLGGPRELTLMSRPVAGNSWTTVATATEMSREEPAVFKVKRRPNTEYRILWPGNHHMGRSSADVTGG